MSKKRKQHKKKNNPIKYTSYFFSVYVVPVTAGTVFGILALSQSLELCSLSHCNILGEKKKSDFLYDDSKVCLI